MGGDKTQTQSTNSEPWGAAQPALQLGLNDAQSVYKTGIGSQPFMGSTVVPNAQQTNTGLYRQEVRANNAQTPFDTNFSNVVTNSQNGGLNALQRGAVDRLTPMADGKMMEGNPYLDSIIDKNSRNMGDAINLQASGMGRTSSGANQQVLAREIGDMANTARYNNYNTERGYMQDAIGSLFNAGQTQQDNINSNTGHLLNAYQGMMAPTQTLMDVGGNYEDLFGRQLNDQLRIFQGQQDQPWNQIGRLNAIASGAGSMGSSGTTTAQGPSRLSAGLGGALGGYSMFGPLGALGGGALGMFG